VLSSAVEDEIGGLKSNPALSLRRKPKRAERLKRMEDLKAIRALTWEQRDALLAVTAEHRPRYHALFAVMVKAGLRPGEAFALKPGDFDWQERTVRIERALSDGGRIKPPKTYEVRTVDLTPDLLVTLQRHLKLRREQALAAGKGEPEWMFVRDDGELLDRHGVGDVLDRMLRKAKLPHFRTYDLRHSYASLLLAEGAPITYVSTQMGHKDAVTTLRHYGHFIPDRQRRWVDVLDRRATATARASATSVARAMEPESGTTAQLAGANAR
jgi:integrase